MATKVKHMTLKFCYFDYGDDNDEDVNDRRLVSDDDDAVTKENPISSMVF